jgi:ankyrin repeat protein
MIAIAQKRDPTSEAIVAALLRQDASLTARDDTGKTVYDHAKIHGRVNELPSQSLVVASPEMHERNVE